MVTQLMVPIRNFAVVDPAKKIYRSAQPEYFYEYKFLKNKLGVKTIVNLRSDLEHDKDYCEELGLNHITYRMPDHFPPTLKQARDFIKLIQTSDGILFHCEHGHGRTSLFCVLARIAMGWDVESAIKEETEVFGYDFQHPSQLEFLRKNFSNQKQLA